MEEEVVENEESAITPESDNLVETSTASITRKKASFQCPLCPKSYLMSYNLIKHVDDVHAKEPAVFTVPCHKCGKKFSSMRNLNKHKRRIHSKQKLGICKCCWKKDIPQGGVPRPSFGCPCCPKTYAIRNSLKKHISRHHNSGNRPAFEKCPADDESEREDTPVAESRGLRSQNGDAIVNLDTVRRPNGKQRLASSVGCKKKPMVSIPVDGLGEPLLKPCWVVLERCDETRRTSRPAKEASEIQLRQQNDEKSSDDWELALSPEPTGVDIDDVAPGPSGFSATTNKSWINKPPFSSGSDDDSDVFDLDLSSDSELFDE